MMETGFWHGGPKPGAFYSLPGNSSTYNDMPRKHTQQPITTGTSVLGVKFDGGIILAADMLGSYGSLARFRNISRLMKVNDQTVLGAGGDYADYQHIKDIIEQRMIDEECLDDGFTYTPKALHSWMTRVMYNRRSQFNPLWNVVVCRFLGFVDKIGTAFKSDVICTGYGAYIAQPLLREAYEKNNAMSEQEAKALVDRCLKVLFYRDARSFNKYEIAIVTKDGARIEGPMSSDTNWDIATMVKGYE